MHFEDIWNESEHISRTLGNSKPLVNIEWCKTLLDHLETETVPIKQAELVGEILFEICGITDKLNINSAAALKYAAEQIKAKSLDPDT